MRNLPSPAPGAVARAVGAGLGEFRGTLATRHEEWGGAAPTRGPSHSGWRDVACALLGWIIVLTPLVLPAVLAATTGHAGWLALCLPEVAAFVALVVLLPSSPPLPSDYLHMYEHGLDLPWEDGSTSLRWSDCAWYREGFDVDNEGRTTGLQLTLCTGDGLVVKVSGALGSDTVALLRQVRERAVGRRLPGAAADVAEGRTAHFGAVAVGPDGITLRPRELTVPWRDVDAVVLDTYRFTIRTGRTRRRVPAGQIDDPSALIALLEERRVTFTDRRPAF